MKLNCLIRPTVENLDMSKSQVNTDEQFNNLIEFRQSVYGTVKPS